jgi:hypothetical protein
MMANECSNLAAAFILHFFVCIGATAAVAAAAAWFCDLDSCLQAAVGWKGQTRLMMLDSNLLLDNLQFRAV